MTQITPNLGDIIFLCSGNHYPNFTKLYCDCVCVVKEKIYWKEVNKIQIEDEIIDNIQAYEKHYKWINPPYNEHRFERRKRRFTLKADADKSFQPQNSDGSLIDIIPFLSKYGITDTILVNSIAKTKNRERSRNSKPYKLSVETAYKLYEF